MAAPIAGSTSGVFDNPTGGPGMVVAGVGTNFFQWSTPNTPGTPQNSLRFTGTAFDSTSGSFFDVGTITYFNGTGVTGTAANSVDLAITLDFTNPVGVVETFTYHVDIVSTPNDTGTPEGDADRIEFSTIFPHSFLLDGQLVTLVVEIGATGPNGFGTQNTFSVFEGAEATATLRGIVRATVVPEPGMLALFGLGAIVMVSVRRRCAS